jgi:hypothetical protein
VPYTGAVLCRYVGGETRLVGLKRTNAYSDFLQQLSKATSAVWDEVRPTVTWAPGLRPFQSCLQLYISVYTCDWIVHVQHAYNPQLRRPCCQLMMRLLAPLAVFALQHELLLVQRLRCLGQQHSLPTPGVPYCGIEWPAHTCWRCCHCCCRCCRAVA